MRSFNYMITRTDKAARCMDVYYEADGYEPVLVGVRLPKQGEDVADVIKAAAPHAIWDAIDFDKLPVVVPEVGSVGRVDVPPEPSVEPEPEIIMRRVSL